MSSLRESRVVPVVLLVAVGLAAAACSSSSPPTPSPTTSSASTATTSPTPTATGEPTSGAGAISAIEANWAKFFNAKTPVAQRLALLENGQVFAPVIRAQAGVGLAAEATSKVTHVSLTGTDQASVTYDILLGGKPALSNQSGEAVYQDGVWKVGTVSFCALLKLEGANVPACKT